MGCINVILNDNQALATIWNASSQWNQKTELETSTSETKIYWKLLLKCSCTISLYLIEELVILIER